MTGASRGIGREVAVALAAEGASVRGVGRDEAALASLAREHDVVPVVTDLRDDTAVWTALDEMMERDGGPPNILVNAAGVFGIAAIAEESVKGFDAQIELNLRAPFIVTRIVLPGMLERGSGCIVNIGSIAGRKAFPGNAAYSASKFG
ncbi:MAG: SDR family oxidoreductase, partial [Acidobacteriota bacterium]|nr:SDR family oxidoreductase [Acidobacteriota bacterium]